MTSVIGSASEMRQWCGAQRDSGRSIGFVATQGCLHKGHGSLITAARANDDVVAVSVFVNPLQFAGEGYERYPRTLDEDIELARRRGADVVFAPSVEEMYPGASDPTQLTALTKDAPGADPEGFVTRRAVIDGSDEPVPLVRVPTRLSMKMDGRLHPWHFDGVATVVARLFTIIRPTRAYFGIKDIQQLAIIESLRDWLGSDTRIVRVPTVRDQDGLSSSSRLSQLSDDARARAARFVESILALQRSVHEGHHDMRAHERTIRARAEQVGGVEIDSIDIVDPRTLDHVDQLTDRAVVYAAYLVEGLRLQECVEVSAAPR